MLRSKYAGGGNSHIAKYFSKLGYKTLFAIPKNNLSQNIQDDAATTKSCSLYLWATEIRGIQSSYHNKETILFTIGPYYGNSNQVP